MDAESRRLVDAVPLFRGREVIVTPLEGGITNRILRVDAEEGAFVIRALSNTTDHLGIDRDREHRCTCVAAEIGIGPEVVHYSREDGVLVVRFAAGSALTPERCRAAGVIERIARAVATCHGGPAFPGTFSPFETVRTYRRIARQRGVDLPAELAVALERLGAIERALGGPVAPVPCHNDLLGGNLLDDGTTLSIIDWEYGAMGDADFDLGNVSAHLELDDDGVDRLLSAYEPGAGGRRRARVGLMTLASDLREALWGFLQSGVSTLDFDYRGYADRYLGRFLAAFESDRTGLWLREAAVRAK